MKRYQNRMSLINEAIQTVILEIDQSHREGVRSWHKKLREDIPGTLREGSGFDGYGVRQQRERLQRSMADREERQRMLRAQQFEHGMRKRQLEFDAEFARFGKNLETKQRNWWARKFGEPESETPPETPPQTPPPSGPPDAPPQTPPPSGSPDAPPPYRPPHWDPSSDQPYPPDPSKPPVSPWPPEDNQETPPQTPPPGTPPQTPPAGDGAKASAEKSKYYKANPTAGDGVMASAKKSEYYTANPIAKDRPQNVMAVANQLSKMAGPSPLRSRPIQNRMA